jgi:PadR family transcriptional regulator PadR
VDTSQLLKGVLPTAALALVERGDAYGYQVLNDLRNSGLHSVGDASVYGTLQRLYDSGMLSSYLASSNSGPSRRYYALTAEGSTALKTGRDEWHDFNQVVTALLEPPPQPLPQPQPQTQPLPQPAGKPQQGADE